jgi:hypothetical protein
VALGYQQLRGSRKGLARLKTVLDLRPVFHRKEERIRAHVLLCWLALLLIRVAETATYDTWRHLRDELDRLDLGTFRGAARLSRRRPELTARQRHAWTPSNLPHRSTQASYRTVERRQWSEWLPPGASNWLITARIVR